MPANVPTVVVICPRPIRASDDAVRSFDRSGNIAGLDLFGGQVVVQPMNPGGVHPENVVDDYQRHVVGLFNFLGFDSTGQGSQEENHEADQDYDA